MSYNLNEHPGMKGRVRILLAAGFLLLAWAFGLVGRAAAQKVTHPTTPAIITPPAGHSAFLVGHAVGTQGYVCLPANTGASWTVNGSRPEATLFAGTPGNEVQIITHFLSSDTSPNEFAPSR